MPHRRLSSIAGTCEIVLRAGEPPCLEPRGPRERPRLCFNHHQEYVRATRKYQATTEEAKTLFARVYAQKITNAASGRDVAALKDALNTANRCIDAVTREISERQKHHGRFFVELHEGHEERIRKQIKRRAQVEAIASQLRLRSAALVNGQKRRSAKQKHPADEPRKRKHPVRPSHPKGKSTTEPHKIPVITRRNSCPSRLETALVPHRPVPPICVAYLTLADSSSYPSTRCTLEALPDATRCQAHEDEYGQVSLELLATKEKQRAIAGAVYYIEHGRYSEYTLEIVTRDINTARRLLSLTHQVDRLRVTEGLLEGGSSRGDPPYGMSDVELYGLTLGVVTNLLNRLEGFRAELRRPKPPPPPPQNHEGNTTRIATSRSSDGKGNSWMQPLAAVALIAATLIWMRLVS